MSHKKTILRLMDDNAEKPFGWDGDSALPIRQDAMGLVRGILHDPELSLGRLEACKGSSLCMGKDGTISILLDFEGKQAGFRFVCGAAIRYIQLYEDKTTSMEGTIWARTGQEIVGAVRHVNSILEWLVWGYQGWRP